MEDGEPVSKDLNDQYWNLRDIGEIKITSGFRVWEEEGDSRPEWKGDAPELTYKLTDFEDVKKYSDVKIPDELKDKEDGDDSGAAALAAAAAAALAAFLIV